MAEAFIIVFLGCNLEMDESMIKKEDKQISGYLQVLELPTECLIFYFLSFIFIFFVLQMCVSIPFNLFCSFTNDFKTKEIINQFLVYSLLIMLPHHSFHKSPRSTHLEKKDERIAHSESHLTVPQVAFHR